MDEIGRLDSHSLRQGLPGKPGGEPPVMESKLGRGTLPRERFALLCFRVEVLLLRFLLLACWLCVFCVSVEMDDDVAAASEQVQKLWADATQAAQKQLQAIVACESTRDAAALPRMNALVQDRMATLRSLMLRLELIAQQYPTYVCCCFYYSSELTRKKKKKPQIRVWCRYFLARNILRSWKGN